MKAILVPQDPEKSMVEVEGETVPAIAKTHSNIGWVEIVDTRRMYDHNFCMVVDEEGLAKETHYRNTRAQRISLYPGPIHGDVLLFSREWVNDGMDLVSVDDRVMRVLKNWHI